MRRDSRLWLSVLVLLSASLCQQPASGQPTSRPGQRAPAAAKPAAEPTPEADLPQQLATLRRKISRLRGLRFRREIPLRLVPRQVILDLIRQQLLEHYPPQQLAAQGALLQHLGLLPPDLDYQAARMALLQEQVNGLYDVSSRQLLLATELPQQAQQATLVRELCRALQDQHFNLRRFNGPLKPNSDQRLARAALLDGDCLGVLLELVLTPQDLGATSAGLDELFRANLERGASPALKAAPTFLREGLLFPYARGLTFIQELRARSSWSRINQLYRHPPETTEQVLHPEKYSAREKPTAIQARPLPLLAGQRQLKQDVLGEFQLRLLLEQAVQPEVAQRAADGWDGDLLLAFSPPGALEPVLSLHLSRWDSALDAREFANALRRSWVARGLSAQPSGTPSGWAFADPAQRRWLVQLYDQLVLALGGVPPELAEPLRRQVWEHWRIGGRRVTAP